jgi:hypothetical protein
MMKALRSVILCQSIAALYALAMLAVGFSCKALLSEKISDPTAVAYMLPDGSVADICSGKESGQQEKHHAFAEICDMCLLAMAPGLQITDDFVVVVPGEASIIYAQAAQIPAPSRSIDAPRSRGPPRPFLIG